MGHTGEEKLFLGIDVGAVSANTVVIDGYKNIIEEHYHRIHGQPVATARAVLEEIFLRIPSVRFSGISCVGTAGKVLADLLDAHFSNEITAQCKAVEFLHPQVRTVIEMGGEDSKLILLEYDQVRKQTRLKDFSMNTMCAAGTGSFLDQQSHRLHLSIEAFGALALKSDHPPRIAGRCSVFAKSDMIHLQQIATPDYDIVAGLCFAVARNFKSTIGRGIPFQPPVSFQGGVAANVGMRRAFAEILGLTGDQFIIPKYFASMGAIGACLLVLEDPALRTPWSGWDKLDSYLVSSYRATKGEPSLATISPTILSAEHHTRILGPTETTKGFLGVDVGSISTNVVVIDEEKNVLAKRYLMTAGRPIEAIKESFKEINEELAGRVEIIGSGTTGSGRYLTGDFIGADVVRNEITAQATASAYIDPEVDTIFEIGGQDSKYISLKSGVVVDFEMNKVCAAGTGSFLEEQAEKLGIAIKDEFGDMALSAPSAVPLGERCTVFMESDLVHHQQGGARKDELAAGLCYSIVHNYLNKVVEKKPVGNHIFFQGGTAFNRGVVAAFEKVVGKRITVPPHNEVTGAIGAALLAMKEKEPGPTKFKGFDVGSRPYDLSTFECSGCSNMCEIHKLHVTGDRPLFYGGRCEKYEMDRTKADTSRIPDLFGERDALLHHFEAANNLLPDSAPTVGIPRALFFYDLLPFWGTYFNTLGYRVVLSEKTNKALIRQGVEAIVAETCFPVKVIYGHALDLIKKGVKTIFLPSLIDLKHPQKNITQSFACPWVQSVPYTIQSGIDFESQGVDFVHPPVFMGDDPARLEKTLQKIAARFHCGKNDNRRAFGLASKAQHAFSDALRQRGAQILSRLGPEERALVIVSRPYNGCDAGINLRIPQKLREMGVLAIPLDMLPLEDVDLSKRWRGMYWAYGQKILAAAHFVKYDPRLFSLYITNFSCGPDSFITHFFKKELEDTPYLQIEIDEHSADAGVITRLEAFLDSLHNVRRQKKKNEKPAAPTLARSNGNHRTVYLPFMTDHVHALAGAFRACGTPAEVTPESDTASVRIARKYTSGRECYPCILTVGMMMKMLRSPGFDPDKSAFFMPTAGGPCRFGQYFHFQRMLLDELGYPEIPIYALNQDDGIYQECSAIGTEFTRLAWQGIVAIDLLEKKARETRPYECSPGETDRLYDHYLTRVRQDVTDKKDLMPLLKEARNGFFDIAIDRHLEKPVIGIVGEIYIRSNPFGNENIVRQIEALGAEVWMPPIGEWFYYTNFTALRSSLKHRRYGNFLRGLITNLYQRYDEHYLERVFGPILKNHPEPTTRQTLRYARPYLDSTFEGEAILSMGKAVDFVKKGVSGLINVMPFSCMPGTIVNALLKRFREIEGNVPILNMSFDGQEQTNTRTRLEAFVYQVHQFKEHKNG